MVSSRLSSAGRTRVRPPRCSSGVLRGSTGFAVPTLNGKSVNLDSLGAGTLYYFRITDSEANGPSDWTTGSFRTVDAPLGMFTGWVYSEDQSFSQYHLNPVGQPIQSASVGVSASCPNGLTATWQQRLTPSGSTTNSSGGYNLSFPITQTSGTTKFELWANNDTCGEWLSGVWIRGVNAGSNLTLVASYPGDFNGTWTVGSTLTASNDYREFVLPPNIEPNVPVGVALIHTVLGGTNYYNAECGFTFQASSSQQTVQQTIASFSTQFFGASQQTQSTEGTTDGSIWTSAGSWGNETGLEFGYPASGYVNESNIRNLGNAFIVGKEQGYTGVLTPIKDWLYNNGTPTPLPAARPAGYGFAVPGFANTRSSPIGNTTFTGGTFSSTSSLDVNISFPIKFGGVSGNINVGLGYSTTITTQVQYYESCSFAYVTDPSGNGGAPYFYWFNEDTGTSSSVVHVWLEGWCGGRGGEQVCP